MKKDILEKKDIEQLVRSFYAELLTNSQIKRHFEGLNFDNHIPQMVSFWSFVLLDEEGYKTNVFDKHLRLSLTESDFDIWLNQFEKTVNSLFEGERAELAKQRANSIAFTFKQKFKQLGKLG